MNVQDAAEGVQKAASAAHYGGVAVAAGGSAVLPVTEYLGRSVTEWQVIGILGGLGIAFVGMALNAAINGYFSWRRDQREAAKEQG